MNDKKKNIILSIILLLVSIIYTVLVAKIDVQAIGPLASKVGFAKINGMYSNYVIYSPMIYKISKYLGYLPIIMLGGFALIGLIQLIKRKSLKKVDYELYMLAIFYVLLFATYFFFEKLVINYRPILMDGELDPSFPSSHTMLAFCLCISTIMINVRLFKNNKYAKIENIVAFFLLYAITITRLISGVHWLSDIIGGIIISFTLLQIFKTMLLFTGNPPYKRRIKPLLIVIYVVLFLCSSFIGTIIAHKMSILPKPELSDGLRGDLGIDKNINEETIDKYLNRPDAVYRDVRMLEDPGNYEAIGGDRYLSGYINGFTIIPLPYIAPVTGLPEEVGDTYTGNTLFSLDEHNNYVPNYEESMTILEKYFPKDKTIFIMCGGGGYAGQMKNILVSLGWNKDLIYDIGGYWYYKGENSINTPKKGNNYDFSKVPYVDIDFSSLKLHFNEVPYVDLDDTN